MVLSADVLQVQIEKVRPKVEELFETSDTVAAMIKKGGEAEIISEKLYRIPIVTRRGGSYRSFNADGGDMGTGSGLSTTNLEAGYYYSDYVVELSKYAMDATAKGEQAVLNAFSYNFKNAMKELQALDDIVFHTNGTGELTNPSSATGTWGASLTSYTFAGSTDFVGVSRVRPGMIVSVYNSAGSTQRTGTASTTEFQINSVDTLNKIVYLNDTVGSAASTDILVVAGLSPTLASFQSTWPLSGDSFRHGMYYANDANSSNYFLGQLKSTVPELLANNVAANGSLTHTHGLILQDQIINRRDEDVYKGLVGLSHMAQRTAIYNIGIALSEWFRGKNDKMIDVMPGGVQYSDTFPYVGVTMKLDKRQDKSRLDFLIPKKWGRAMLHDTKFHEVEGRTVFEARTSTGNLAAAVFFILVQSYDYYCVNMICAFAEESASNNPVNCLETVALISTAISSQASQEEGSTTRAKARSSKWSEVRGTREGGDIVSTAMKIAAA
jgi:hypothetical protein